MRKRYCSILLNFFLTLLLGILAGCSGGVAVHTRSAPPRSTQTPNHPGPSPDLHVSSPTVESQATPPYTLTPFPGIAPYQLISPDEFSLEFSMDTPIPPGEYIVAVEDSLTDDPEMQFRVLTLSGERVSTINVELTDESISNTSLFTTLIFADTNQLLIGVAEGMSTRELYIFDPYSMTSWGIELTCETLRGFPIAALGAEFLAFRCVDDLNTWHFVSTSNPSTSYSIRIKMPHEQDEAIWVGPGEVLFKSKFEKAFCLGSIPNWDPICEDIPFWPGRLAADVGLLEIREGRPEKPTAIGALSLDCLRTDPQGCDPILIENPFSNLQQPWSLHSAWVPGTTSIVYLKLVDHDLSTFAFDQTELWLVRYPEGDLTMLDVLDGEVFLTELEFPNAPVIWLDNGTEVILNKLNDLIIYNIETGEQSSIGYHGKVLGTIEIK